MHQTSRIKPEARHWWLTHKTLITLKAKTGKILVPRQPREKSLPDPISMGKRAGCGDAWLSSQ
jgi:hypothetical protein